MNPIRLYDNGGATADRYTAVDMRRPERQAGTYAAVGFNEAPFHPQGFGQHTVAMPGAHLGRRIKPDALPEQARRFFNSFVSEVHDYATGERVELHPGTDAWMQGDRYGEVVKVTPSWVYVRMDKSARTLRFARRNIYGRF